ncbi:MAG TPA: hypothetical protein VJY35_01600 [Candidatus Eisenbacteria bacterium]|nr:hypothetical protein [Candidatus Eisenbacteria bacterium]
MRRRLILLALPAAAGVVFAWSALNAPHGYAAAYDFGGAWVVALTCAVIGGLLVLRKRWRPAGAAGLVAAVTLLLAFYVVYFTGYGLGLHAWKKTPRVTIPPTGSR